MRNWGKGEKERCGNKMEEEMRERELEGQKSKKKGRNKENGQKREMRGRGRLQEK